MSLRNTQQAWGLLAKLLHWLSLLLLIAVWGAIALHEDAPERSAEALKYLFLHKALGVSMGALMVARLIWRLLNPTPQSVPMPVWQEKSAALVHVALYGILLMLPVSGVLMSQWGGHHVSIFGWFNLPTVVSENKDLAKLAHELHTDVFWPCLVLLTLGHVAAAIYHQHVMKDNLIKRMLP